MVVFYAIGVVLLVYALLDLLRTPSSAVRTLPKAVWFVPVLLFPVAGPVGWLLAGRPRGPARRTPPAVRGGPDDDEDFLRELRREADDRRRRARDPRDDEA